jgi:WD40 repeat protein
LAQHKGPVLALALQQSGKRLITAGSDGAVKFSDADSGVLQRTFSLNSPAAVSPAANGLSGTTATTLVSVAIQGLQLYAAYADGSVAVWDLERGERLASTKRLDGTVSLVASASEGDRFAAAGPDGRVMLLDRKSSAPPTLSGESHKNPVRAIGYVPDRNGLLSTSDDRTVKFWDLDGLSLKRTYRGHNGPVTSLDVAPDNRTFASGAEDGQIRHWSAASTRLIRTIRAHSSAVSALAFSANGDMLASAAGDGVVKIWDMKRGKEVHTVITRTGPVRGLAYSTDGRRLISAGEDGTVRAWDISTIKVAKAD